MQKPFKAADLVDLMSDLVSPTAPSPSFSENPAVPEVLTVLEASLAPESLPVRVPSPPPDTPPFPEPSPFSEASNTLEFSPLREASTPPSPDQNVTALH